VQEHALEALVLAEAGGLCLGQCAGQGEVLGVEQVGAAVLLAHWLGAKRFSQLGAPPL
jgi:hypothetical protein